MVVKKKKPISAKFTREEVLEDYLLAFKSREASLVGRREVLSGKAKFGIFGGGKELPQIALAKVFQKGDFRSGYYRDQTLMLAIGEHTLPQFFAQLYAHTDVEAEPATAGRSMNGHYATRSLNPDGSWKNLMEIKNSSADVSPTASQMPRLVGLAYASKLYRELKDFNDERFSNNGNEIAFGTIGNASCSEGMFWESINAISVLRAPAIISIWDDDYGISVSNEFQFARDLSDLLSGFQREEGSDKGFDVYRVKAWDYEEVLKTYQLAAKNAREYHVPSIVHVVEVMQPQGHSTSGSHERYKSKERLDWEKSVDCVTRFENWIISNEYVLEEELDILKKEIKIEVEQIRKNAWDLYKGPIKKEVSDYVDILDELMVNASIKGEIQEIKKNIMKIENPFRKDIMVSAQKTLITLKEQNHPSKQILIDWKNKLNDMNSERINSYLYSESKNAAANVNEIKPIYSENSSKQNGFKILNFAFDNILSKYNNVIAFGEDLGKIGGVNQGFAGLQDKYGIHRVSDTGIRENTIIGQAIGLAMRGFRPIAEIQYLDYLLYALQIMSDDLSTLLWRTKGGQKAPVIIRTRGHRLEGIWHAGSLMAGLIHLVRGMNVLVPRNMVQAVGFYNTLLNSDEPGVVVEVLSGYRLKEKLPDNIGDITIPFGVPEILREGSDMTIVTYGPLCNISLESALLLEKVGISVEIIDVQSLLPFDVDHRIVESLKKTNRIIFLDEDVPGGTTAYMMQEVLENQGGYKWLDSDPITVSAKPHRPAYGTDGDYWSKPNIETVFEAAYEVMAEVDPEKYPIFY